MSHIIIDPITRIEGHLKVEAEVENGVVKDARSTGTLFRGIELILQGRDPRDAQQIAQRICGVCPTSHSIAAALSLDSAFGIDDKIPDNGRIIRIVGTNGTDVNPTGNLANPLYVTFNYDNYGPTKIVVRGVTLLDYTPGGPDFRPDLFSLTSPSDA